MLPESREDRLNIQQNIQFGLLIANTLNEKDKTTDVELPVLQDVVHVAEAGVVDEEVDYGDGGEVEGHGGHLLAPHYPGVVPGSDVI